MAKGKGQSGGRGRASSKKRADTASEAVTGEIVAAADSSQKSVEEAASSAKRKAADSAGKVAAASGGDGLKWFGVALILIAGIVGFYLLSDYSTLGRVIGLLVLLGAALFLASKTVTGASAFEFVKDSRSELRKVVWPTKNETMQTTGLILVVVVIVAIFIWILDTGLAALMKVFIGGSA